MPTDLETVRGRVQDLLKDSGASLWSTSELDQAIRLALAELSTVLPCRAVTTVDAVDEQWEYSVGSVSGLIAVVEVWYPYLSTDDDYKRAHPVKWRMLDESTLYVEPDSAPDATYDLRIFYDKVHTLNGLDAAAATTLDEEQKSALVLGAAAYAAEAKAVDTIGVVNIGARTPEYWRAWAGRMRNEFDRRMNGLAGIDAASDDSRIGWWSADKWDG